MSRSCAVLSRLTRSLWDGIAAGGKRVHLVGGWEVRQVTQAWLKVATVEQLPAMPAVTLTACRLLLRPL